jgi:hypothetical protein
MMKDNPFVGCFDAAVVSGAPAFGKETVLATKPVEAKGKQKGGQKPLHELQRWGDLKSLDQMPKKWWKQVENAKGGYQYQTEVKIMNRYVGCLLDGCAGCNSITEEVVVGAIREALRSGIDPSSDQFPVAQLERWPKEEVVMGLANGAPIKLKGAAVLRVTFPDVSGRKDRQVLVRAKVIANGGSTWHGLILGGRALDAVERGGLGFRPGANAHIFDGLSLKLPRKEETEEYTDHAYPHVAVQASMFDRAWDSVPGREAPGSGEEVEQVCGEVLQATGEQWIGEEGDWVPVRRVSREASPKSSCVSPVEVVLPLADSELEVVPGLWSRDQAEGYVYVTPKEDEKYVQEGEEVAVAVKAVAEQQFCRSCGHFDAVAWTGGQNCCSECECPAAGFRKMSPECQRCGETVFRSELGGCQKKVKGSSSRGCSGVALLLAGLLCFVAAGVVSSDKVYHIVETPGALDLLAEEGPTDKYYQRLRADLSERYPAASEHLLDHLEALEAFLDKSIMAGVTFGIDKAKIGVIEGELLGHCVGRFGARCSQEKTKAVQDFPALREKLHIQQFLGCTNFLRNYLPPEYAHCAKLLGEYMKGAVPFPESGLGEGDTSGDKAVRAIKLMTQRAIELAVLDEAGAITGERPLEQIADSSGYAVGGSALQMQADLGSFKVLAVHSKGLTPAQQAWAPLSLEGYAQLEVRRAVKKQLGPIKSICWTDHANWTRQQTLEQVEPKHLRWLSEILADGSELRSLAGRSARLGDGYSRNPPERDQLLEQRTKDLEGLIGQLRGFSLEEYLSDVSEKVALPWSVGDGVLPEPEEGRSAGNDQVAAVAGELGVLNRSLRNNMFAAGVSSEIRVLYVPDYVARNDRWIQTKELSKLFRTIFPEAEVKVALAEPPFEDPEGNALHFERQGKQHLTGKKLVNATRVDLLTSVATLLREIAKHMPNFVVGAGQGAIVCLAAASPVVVESVLLARNVHITEAHKVASAWAQVKLMFGVNPRIGKSKPGGQLLKEACPEWFTPHVLECLPRLGMVEKYVPVREEIEELLSCAGVMQVNSLESVMWSSWLERDSKELWEHEGQCACGRRTRLFGQCMRCIEAEHAEEVQRRADQGAEEEDQNVERRFELEGGPDVTAKIEPLIERDPVTRREELSGTAEKWLNEHLKRRKEKVEELKEESELAVGADLRSDWFKSQRSDDKLMSVIQKCLKRTEETNKFRLAEDGLLERLLERDGQNGELWVYRWYQMGRPIR